MRASIVVAVVTICMKGLAWWITDSVGLLSDAMESFVNLASAGFGLVMVTIARRPADADHPYGHHKAEYFSSGFEGLLIILAAVGIIWAAVLRLFHPQPLDQLGLGLALSVLSSAINGALAWAMMQASRLHRSIALEGGARHLITDVWTSAGVVVGVGLVAFSHWQWLDAAVALGVALNILRGLPAPHHPVRSHFQPALGQAPFSRSSHAHAVRLDLASRGRGADVGGTGADECGPGTSRDHPAAAQRC